MPLYQLLKEAVKEGRYLMQGRLMFGSCTDKSVRETRRGIFRETIY